MSDIIERLSIHGLQYGSMKERLLSEAADEILRLRKLLDRCGFCDTPLEEGACPNEWSESQAQALVEYAARHAEPGAEGDGTPSSLESEEN